MPSNYSKQITRFLAADGSFQTKTFCSFFGIQESGFLRAVGLDEVDSDQFGPVVRGAAEVLLEAADLSKDRAKAFDWFCSTPIPSFGGVSARELVAQGNVEAVKSYLTSVRVGGFE